MKLFVRLRRFVEKGRHARAGGSGKGGSKSKRLFQPPAPQSILAGVQNSAAPVVANAETSATLGKEDSLDAEQTSGGSTDHVEQSTQSVATAEVEDEAEEDDMDGWA